MKLIFLFPQRATIEKTKERAFSVRSSRTERTWRKQNSSTLAELSMATHKNKKGSTANLSGNVSLNERSPPKVTINVLVSPQHPFALPSKALLALSRPVKARFEENDYTTGLRERISPGDEAQVTTNPTFRLIEGKISRFIDNAVGTSLGDGEIVRMCKVSQSSYSRVIKDCYNFSSRSFTTPLINRRITCLFYFFSF